MPYSQECFEARLSRHHTVKLWGYAYVQESHACTFIVDQIMGLNHSLQV